ncbi:YhgE/Pip N-terminal domain-containing protein [Terribacillus aidingensis]|uniref:YhgE/Pip N-terminal domain-containing protein n=1 Tax=Terribacillus aidingensis TaxID=586416 RepID=A0A285N896_9BACI|nr:ABC transporter permease [Terribacillus aidingensis]SNZ05714.1 YhgE/Pip N-terminal domain-containing protein [Terribacillus aidingensis]
MRLQPLREMMKIPNTKVGIAFAIIVPLLFAIIWLTGYHNATTHFDRLKVAVVNEDGSQADSVAEQMTANLPFSAEVISYKDAREQLDANDITMMIVIPEAFTKHLAAQEDTSLEFHMNSADSQVALSAAESAARQMTASIGGSHVQADIIKENSIRNFATSMVPMMLGFIVFIAFMTMNIQFNIVTQILNRKFGKWQVFWNKQLLLAIIGVVVPTIIVTIHALANDTAASYMQLWGFELLVAFACISFTQMSFAIFGNAGALFNVAMIPFMLMTAGNIIPVDMLSPVFHVIGNILPASNGVQGFAQLIYNGEGAAANILHLLFILIITFALTCAAVMLKKQQVQYVARDKKSAEV